MQAVRHAISKEAEEGAGSYSPGGSLRGPVTGEGMLFTAGESSLAIVQAVCLPAVEGLSNVGRLVNLIEQVSFCLQ